MGMTNMAATIPGFVVPALVGHLTHGVVSFMSIFIWNKVFFSKKGNLKKEIHEICLLIMFFEHSKLRD